MINSIAARASVLLGALNALTIICAVLMIVRLVGEDDGSWGAYVAVDQIKAAIGRDAGGRIEVRMTQALKEVKDQFPSMWYVVTDATGWVTYGPVPESRLQALQGSEAKLEYPRTSMTYTFAGQVRHLSQLRAQGHRSPEEPLSVEVGGVAFTAPQMIWATVTDSTFFMVPAFAIFLATLFGGLIVVPFLVTRPVRRTAAAVEMIDGTQEGARVPESSTPSELRPIIGSFNRALQRIDNVMLAQRHFLSNAAHELRSPLTKIRMQAEGIENRAIRQGLIRDVHKLSSTVTLLLQMARLSSEPAQLEKVDLVAVARKAAADEVPTALQRGYEISFIGTDCAVPIKGSAQAITIAVSNLIRNALLHSKTKQPVIVRVTAPGVVSVTDHGVGMVTDRREAMLAPFARGHNVKEGTGLGLAIVSQVMALHGGLIAVDETPGGGVCIALTFPALNAA